MTLPNRLLWPTLILLVLVGVSASTLRVLAPTFTNDVVIPARARAMASIGVVDPRAAERLADVDRFERKFAQRRGTVLWHVVPGGLFLLFAPLQFVRRIRQRHIALHRRSGRALLLLAFASVPSALYFGFIEPAGGRAESLVIGLFGMLFVVALARAWLAIRAKRVSLHREWMIRAFAVALGISMVRVYAAPLDVLLTARDVSSGAIFVISLWCGFGTTSLLAEYWILHTRPRARAALAPANVLA